MNTYVPTEELPEYFGPEEEPKPAKVSRRYLRSFGSFLEGTLEGAVGGTIAMTLVEIVTPDDLTLLARASIIGAGALAGAFGNVSAPASPSLEQ